MRVLVTNDDGILAPGLRALAKALIAGGHDVLVVAPVAGSGGDTVGGVARRRGLRRHDPRRVRWCAGLRKLANSVISHGDAASIDAHVHR